jgi:hypothetical protein
MAALDESRQSFLAREEHKPHVTVENMSEPQNIVAAHFPGLNERSRPTVERLIELVLDVLPDAQYEQKWGRLTFTREGDWHHWICAISVSKAVKLVVHKGALLADPRGVMEGEGRYSRAIPFRSAEDIDADVVAPILREAVIRQADM